VAFSPSLPSEALWGHWVRARANLGSACKGKASPVSHHFPVGRAAQGGGVGEGEQMLVEAVEGVRADGLLVPQTCWPLAGDSSGRFNTAEAHSSLWKRLVTCRA
jgi:hypothetical protein